MTVIKLTKDDVIKEMSSTAFDVIQINFIAKKYKPLRQESNTYICFNL
jgi:hypothetical protein